MNNLQRIILLIITLCLALPSWAAEPRQQPTDQERARTLYIFHQPMVMLQAKFGLTTPEERVLRVRNTLRNFTQADISQPLQVVPVTRYNQHGRLFIMNGKPLMLLTEGDLDEGDDLTLDQATQRVLTRMEAQRTALLQQYDTAYLVMSVVKTIAGGTVLALFWYGAYKAWRRLRRYYHRKHLAKVSTTPHNLRRFIGTLETKLSLLITILAGVVAFYLWLSWSFSLYPWTRVWGESLGEWLVSMFQQIVVAIISSLPGMVIVVVIFLITAFIIKLLKALLKQVELGSVSIPGLHPETVGTTRKLISAMVWLFALSAAYPFLPGANSLAFKGISVFFGLMLTLGSAGVMNHAMSGLVLIYSRALRKGDVIRIADNEGLVSEIGMLATKIITRENYVVTLPNAVVVSGKITNLSANNAGGAINLTTSVTIGYDTPWRQVQAMLELAARRTGVVEPQVPPLVRQLELMDWYVAYELQVRLVQGTPLAAARNELHGHIQDVFNEFNVQIMSPHFVLQPDNNLVVPQEGWYPAPATPPDGKPQ